MDKKLSDEELKNVSGGYYITDSEKNFVNNWINNLPKDHTDKRYLTSWLNKINEKIKANGGLITKEIREDWESLIAYHFQHGYYLK